MGKWSNLTSRFFQMGWFNHHLVIFQSHSVTFQWLNESSMSLRLWKGLNKWCVWWPYSPNVGLRELPKYYCKCILLCQRWLRTLVNSDFAGSVCCWLLFHKRGNEQSLFWRRQIVCYLVEQMPDAWVQYFRKCLCHGVSRLLSGVFKNRWQFPKILVVYELSTGENLEGLCLGTVLLYQKFESDLGHHCALNINGRPTDHSQAMGLYCGWLLFQSKGEATVCIFPAQCVAKILCQRKELDIYV